MNGDLRAQKQYGKNYYEQYDNENTLPYAMFLTHDKIDQKLKPMERVVEIKGRYSYTIYPFKLVAQEGVIQDNHEGLEVLTFYRKGALSVLDHQEIAHSKDIVMATVFDARLNGKG